MRKLPLPLLSIVSFAILASGPPAVGATDTDVVGNNTAASLTDLGTGTELADNI